MHKTARKYSRIAWLFDWLESPIERLAFHRLRQEAVQLTFGKTLELGVGTGKNLSLYPDTQNVTAIDFSPGMLQRARTKQATLHNKTIDLREMDIQSMTLPDHSFDSSLSTFVFCTVPEPDKGLRQLYRVLKPGARAIFLEHQRSHSLFINLFLYLMDPMMRLFLGTSMVRNTQQAIETAGFTIEKVDHKLLDVVRLIQARKP